MGKDYWHLDANERLVMVLQARADGLIEKDQAHKLIGELFGLEAE